MEAPVDRPSIGVVLTRLPERSEFCRGFVIPSIETQMQAGDRLLEAPEPQLHVCKKRNRWRELGQELVFFCDDDVILRRDAFSILSRALECAPRASMAYCDYMGIVVPPLQHPKGPVFIQKQSSWNKRTLATRNVASTMSLWRREHLEKFGIAWNEESIGLDDWDMALQLLKAGGTGVYVPETLFHAYFLTEGRARREGNYYEERVNKLRERHGAEWVH